MSQLRHPNLVQFLGVHYKSGSDIPILVMECLPMSLTQCLEQYKMIPNHIKNSILLDVSLGLLYLHKQTPPIVHRDLTANNVLLISGLKAKISDVGIVPIVEPQLMKQYILMMSYPNIESYLPPEVQRQNVRISPEIDIFSFGNLILHTFTHKWPVPTDLFNEDNMALTEVQRRKYLFNEIESSNPLKQLAERCLHNRPQSRPNTSELVTTIQVLDRNNEIMLPLQINLKEQLQPSQSQTGISFVPLIE